MIIQLLKDIKKYMTITKYYYIIIKIRFFHILRDKDTLPNNFTVLNRIIITLVQKHLCRILLLMVYITNIKSDYMF